MATRLQQLREQLRLRDVDFQKSYQFLFSSLKLLILRTDLYIINVEHPFYNFTNEGDYRGYISAVTKPSDITITFLEDDDQTVLNRLEMWDDLKFNKATGIQYPKAVYEDQAFLTYLGPKQKGNLFETADTGQIALEDQVVQESKVAIDRPLPGNVVTAPSPEEKRRNYLLTGLYPINRNAIQLAYESNDIVKVTAIFNVDTITPMNIAGIPGTNIGV